MTRENWERSTASRGCRRAPIDREGNAIAKPLGLVLWGIVHNSNKLIHISTAQRREIFFRSHFPGIPLLFRP